MSWETVYSLLQKHLLGRKLLQKLNNGLQSAVKQAKLPTDFIFTAAIIKFTLLKHSKQQKNLFGCLLTAGMRDRMKNSKPITPNKSSWISCIKKMEKNITKRDTSFLNMFLFHVSRKNKLQRQRLGRKNFHLKLPKTLFPLQIHIAGTADKNIACVVHLEETGWLQISSGPATISKWFSQRKTAFIFSCLVRDQTSLGNKSRYESLQGKKNLKTKTNLNHLQSEHVPVLKTTL